MQTLKPVEEAVEELVNEWNDTSSDVYNSHTVIRIKDIAKHIHPHYWKYRDVILPKIQEWFGNLESFDDMKYSPLTKQLTINNKVYMITTSHGMSDVYGHFYEGGHLGGSGCLLCLDLKEIKR